MGKHDKAIATNSEEFLMATIEKLRKENETLKVTIRAMERDAARQDRAYDRNADRTDEIIAQKDKEIAFWKHKVMRLVEKHV